MSKIDQDLQKDFNYADNLFKEKKFKESAKKYEDILKNNPNLISVKNNLGLCYEGLGEFKKAIDLFKNCVEARQEIIFLNNAARVLFRVKDYENSIIYLENSIKMNNNQINIIELLTAAYNQLNLANKIVTLLENLIKKFPKNRFLNSCYGKNLLKLNRHAEGLYYLNLGNGVVKLKEGEEIKILSS
tara:strand:- start:1340 stop:1900 length:561 start_codon:yes stop_codon:yes gene_type:complete